MKLLLASEYFHPHWTGIAKAFLVLAHDLKKDGHEVTVLTTQFDPSSSRHERTSSGLTIIRSPAQFKISRTHYSFSALIEFARLVLQNDQVIINSPHSNILFFTILAKLCGKKVTIFHQGDLTLPRLTGSQLSNRMIECIFDMLTIPAFFLANNISTYTKDYAQNSRTMKYFMKKFFAYIPCLPMSEPTRTGDDRRAPSSKKILIGFAGRFVEEKGFDILYQAMREVVEEIPNAHFVFAGQKKMDYEPFYESRKEVFEGQKKNVTYLGLLNEKDLIKFYQSLSVFVVSSRSDCFPLTQIEAAKIGIPLVCTNIPGARVLVKETGFGVIVENNSSSELARGIIEVVKKREQFMKHQKNVMPFFKKYENFEL